MTKRNISKLLICGGGFKFFYLYGAIKYLDEINILQNITEYIGVSAGGLLCTLFSIGYTPKDIELFILEFNFEKLLDPHLDSLLEKKGLDNGEIKKVAIQQFFTKKDIDPEITFKQLYELTNKKINFIAANLTLNKLEILNYETYPDMEVWKGLLITTALPFLYEPVIHNEQFLADGGLFDNYPIELFIDDDKFNDSINRSGYTSNLNIGIIPSTPNPFASCLLQLNGNDRFDHRVGTYFNYVQPYQHHTNIPENKGINVYSFAIKPEEHQPSGTLNMSRIDTAVLSVESSFTATQNINIYAVNYNVLRILSGMGGLAYSN